jgi:metallophosphoesterase (TIGR00282 family)
MKVLVLGEIIGRPGREAVGKTLPGLKKKYKPDLIITNGEHLAHGRGLSLNKVAEMSDMGIDFFTTGNHVWGMRDFVEHLDEKDLPVLRPANYPPSVPGRGFQVLNIKKQKVLIINLIGRVFFPIHFDSPFETIDRILKKQKINIVIVDFHAEATSEKVALGKYLDGRVSLVFGTHTHIPTSDYQILPKGEAYLTDIGMIGPADSVLGAEYDEIINHFLTQMPWQYKVASGPCIFNALVVDIDEKTGKTITIEKIEKMVKV